MTRLAALLLALMLPVAATAQMVAEAPDEARVRDLARSLRCPVCQSESILESRAGTAQEMMVLLREMVAEGRADADIVTFFRDRYGDFIMLAPPREGAGRVIWALPAALFLVGAGVLAANLRRRRTEPTEEPISALDATRLKEMEL